MRLSSVLAAAAVLSVFSAFAPEAKAFGSDAFVTPEGRDLPLGARRRGSRGDCEGESTMCDDPYAYKYKRRAWYPGYNSHYWVPADEMKNRYRYSFSGQKFRYYPAWGIDKATHHKDAHHDGVPLK